METAAALKHPIVVIKMGTHHDRNPFISEPNTEASIPHYSWTHPGNLFSAAMIGSNPFQASQMDPKPGIAAVPICSVAPMSEPAEYTTKPTKQPKKKPSGSKKSNKQFEPGTKVERKNPNVVFNEADLNFSGVPTPYCSCTGVARGCNKNGAGGWQSSCCSTNISEYPLPMSCMKPWARVAGRKMSSGAYGKLLCRLAAEGRDLSHPLDLKDHWARLGTKKFVTINTLFSSHLCILLSSVYSSLLLCDRF
ncbi:unnamed protein product [Camellia sinensis]